MTQADQFQIRSQESSMERGSDGAVRRRLPGVDDWDRIAELERENNRLQLLVAELLIKNQQLRRAD